MPRLARLIPFHTEGRLRLLEGVALGIRSKLEIIGRMAPRGDFGEEPSRDKRRIEHEAIKVERFAVSPSVGCFAVTPSIDRSTITPG